MKDSRFKIRKIMAAIALCCMLVLVTCKETTKDGPANVPALTTTEVSVITTTVATSGGNITDDGGAKVTERGVCWGDSPDPTIDGNRTYNGSGTGSFSSRLAGLTAGTIYYVRAYATNSEGTSYGNEVSFTTGDITMPVLTTDEVSDISYTTATAGGHITNEGISTCIERGVCYATTANPTVADTKIVVAETGTGSFTAELNGLTVETKYYVRAYATNSAGTAYGNEVNFTTEAPFSFTVTFNSNGGSSVENIPVIEGDRVPKPAHPAKAGGNYFAGWYKDETLTTEWLFDTDVVTSNITLYAKWAQFTIPFETREEVLKFLKYCANNGHILFGKDSEFTWGLGENGRNWTYTFTSDADDTHGDIYRITGKFPAVLGLDVLDTGYGRGLNSIINCAKMFAGRKNGLVTISCHPENPWWRVMGRQGDSYRYVHPTHTNAIREILELDGPVILDTNTGVTVKQYYDQMMDTAIDAMLEMKYDNGKQIPLMVRLFHENSGTWFWWGTNRCSASEFIALYRYTADRMKARCSNLMFIYAPDRNWSTLSTGDQYMSRYPGDDYVDILGYDDYYIGTVGINVPVNRLKLLSQYAKEHDKVACLAETGLLRQGGISSLSNWFTDHLGKAITAEGVSISFFLLWHSWSTENGDGMMFPYLYHSPTADDVRNFISWDQIKMQDFVIGH